MKNKRNLPDASVSRPLLAVAVLFIAGALLSVSSPARAGWEFTMEGEGTKSATTADPQQQSWRKPIPRPGGLPPEAPWNTVVYVTNMGGSGSVSTSGTLEVVAKWTPDYDGEQLPEEIPFLITGQAFASAMYNPQLTPPTGSAKVAEKEVTQPTSEHPSRVSSAFFEREWQVDARRLLTMKRDAGTAGPNGSLSWRLPIQAQANFNAGSNGGGGVNVTATAALDTRSVILTRSSKDQPPKLEDGIWITKGDTTYSYTLHADVPSYQPNYQTINAALSGGWSTDALHTAIGQYNVTWNWVQTGNALETSTTAGDHYDHADRIAAQGGIDYWPRFDGGAPRWSDANGNFTPKDPASVTLKYFVRDDEDEATAEARYILTVHEPIELVERRKPVKLFSVHSPAYVPNPNNPNQWILLDAIDGPRTAGSYSIAKSDGAAKSTGYSFGFGGDIKPFGVGLGLHYDHSEGKEWSSVIGTSVSIPEMTAQQHAYLEVEFSYQRLYSTFRRYDAEGEIRRAGSPAAPAPSIPFKSIWDEKADATPSPRWHILNENEPSPEPKNEVPVYSGDPITPD